MRHCHVQQNKTALDVRRTPNGTCSTACTHQTAWSGCKCASVAKWECDTHRAGPNGKCSCALRGCTPLCAGVCASLLCANAHHSRPSRGRQWHVHTDAKARTHHTPRGFAGRAFEAYHRRVEHLVGTFRRLGLDVMLGQNSADPATRGALRWCQLSAFHVKAIGYSCTVQCNICSRCNSQSMRRGCHAVQKSAPA